jgi:small subunit ribosomal protein S2
MNTDIIDLEKTCELFKEALNFVAHIAFKRGIIMFITRDPATIPNVERLAKETGEYAQCRRWQNGTFSDSTRRFGTVIRYPDAVVFLSTNDGFNEQHRAVRECANMLIPTVGIVDTNTDPNLVSYPIPGNDDSIQSIELYCNLFKTVILKAKEKRIELEKQNFVIEY